MEKEKPIHIGISDEIEVPTIAADTATILESDDRIAIPINFDNLSRAKTAKKSSRKCLPFRDFVLVIKPVASFIFLFHFRCAYAELASSVTYAK